VAMATDFRFMFLVRASAAGHPSRFNRDGNV
jgi:hypothetical protein